MEARNEDQPVTLRLKEVAKMLGIGRRSLARYIQAGAFPQPIRLGRSLRYSKQAVLEWIERKGGAR
jgi:excisionase family DNA binding protein